MALPYSMSETKKPTEDANYPDQANDKYREEDNHSEA
jgi:hypothetical protein